MWMPVDNAPPIQTLLWTSSQQHITNGSGPPQQDNVPWHATNTARDQLEEHSKGPKVSTGPPTSPKPNLVKHL